MKYRKLGKTNLKVSAIGLGTWQYCGDWGKEFTDEEVKAILDRAHELGFNLIDSAAGYGPNHLSECMVGKAIKGQRDNWVLSTKFGRYRTGKTEESVVCDFSAAAVQGQLEDSLRAFQTDCIDVYLMHSAPTDQIDNDDLWTMLDKAKIAGKIKATGLSLEAGLANNYHHVELAEKFGCGVIELVYNALDNGPEKDTLPLCQKLNMGVLARVPLAQGYLSGKYKPGTVFDKSDVRSYYYSKEVTDERIAKAQEIIAREVPEGVSPAQWAMAWSVKNPAVAACIPGFKNIAQLEGGAAASELVTDDHPLAVK